MKRNAFHAFRSVKAGEFAFYFFLRGQGQTSVKYCLNYNSQIICFPSVFPIYLPRIKSFSPFPFPL